MAFASSRSADAKKIQKPAPDAGGTAAGTTGAKPHQEKVMKTPPTGTNVPATKQEPVAQAQTQTAGTPLNLGLRIGDPNAEPAVGVSVPEAASQAAAQIREHLKAKASSKEGAEAEPAPTSVRVDATASSNAPTMLADSVPPPKGSTGAVRKSHITPEEQKAALAAGGHVADTPQASARFEQEPPEQVPTKSEVDSARKKAKKPDAGIVVKEVPNGSKNTASDAKPDAPKSDKTEEPSVFDRMMAYFASKGSWKFYIVGISVVVGLVALVWAYRAFKGTSAPASNGKPAITAEPKGSQQPTAGPTIDPTAPPTSSDELVFTKDGLPMTADNMQKAFGQTDAKRFRYVSSEWKLPNLFLCSCAEVQDKARGTYSEATKKYHYPLSVDGDETVSDISGCRICQAQ